MFLNINSIKSLILIKFSAQNKLHENYNDKYHII